MLATTLFFLALFFTCFVFFFGLTGKGVMRWDWLAFPFLLYFASAVAKYLGML
jgi:hypothetical protein